ncbi:hypothetical protein ABID20_004658 [Rhizobium alvei]
MADPDAQVEHLLRQALSALHDGTCKAGHCYGSLSGCKQEVAGVEIAFVEVL